MSAPSGPKSFASALPRQTFRGVSSPRQKQHNFGLPVHLPIRNISTGPAFAQVPQRRVLEVSGRDAQLFLKGLTSRDVEKMGGGYSGVLNASGRVLHDIFIFPRTVLSASTSSSTSADVPSYLIDFPSPPSSNPSGSSSSIPDLTQYLRKFILRSKVRVRDVSSEWGVWNAWGRAEDPTSSTPPRTWKFGSGESAEPTWDLGNLKPELRRHLREEESACWDLRAGWGPEGMGRRLLARQGDRPPISDSDERESVDYSLRRMLLGVPEGSEEIIPESALPLESCMDVMGGIDFRKGCYVGQELTVRTYHTGHTRKRIMPLRFLPPESIGTNASDLLAPNDPKMWSEVASSTIHAIQRPQAGEPITFFPPASAASQKAKAGVKVLSIHPDYAVGLGLVRLEFAERAWGLAEYEQPAKMAMEGERGSLVAGTDAAGWKVWAGKGRAWYTSSEMDEQ